MLGGGAHRLLAPAAARATKATSESRGSGGADRTAQKHEWTATGGLGVMMAVITRASSACWVEWIANNYVRCNLAAAESAVMYGVRMRLLCTPLWIVVDGCGSMDVEVVEGCGWLWA